MNVAFFAKNPPIIELFGPEAITATNITLRNNSFNAYENSHKTLIWINSIAVVEDAHKLHSLTNVHVESSVINLISFGGYNEKTTTPITQPQIFAFANITFTDIDVE